ncbi:hypothetical protein IV203_022277 [Nitzschia inconspicua]|uniref:EH domain-containing protein n=1 Tax=Nitzschia inconspicua TaxID=303405 RepID=A0A9K3KIC9_9STRA|nr:hypothetical protein IV203_022277 [Nitzschia inconspicua]
MTSPSYEPTPLEQAYGLYLAQQIFGIPPTNITPGVRIPGRNAVPFLTQSGLDRTVLRSLWNVADPQNVGSLTDIQQFHLLLRLVAMAQQSMIHSDHTIEDMIALVQEHATRPLMLPIFNGVLIPQPQDSLLTMYGQFLSRTSLLGSITTTTSIDDAFGGLVEVQDAPLCGLQNSVMPEEPVMDVQEHLQPTPQPSGTMVNPTLHTSNMSSLSDGSFGGGDENGAMQPHAGVALDFGTSNNLPLPTLGSMGGSVGSNESFGGIAVGGGMVEAMSNVASQSDPATASTFTSTVVMSEIGAPSNSMGGFVTTPILQQPQHQQSMATTVTEAITDDDDDDFGGFSSAMSTSAEYPSASISQQPGFDTNTSLGAAPINTSSTLNISDAFGEIPVQDAPLSSLHSFNAAPEPAPLDDNDFGNFSAIPLKAGSAEVTAVIDDEEDFGDFGSAAQPSMSGEFMSQVSGAATGVVAQQQPFMTDIGRAMSEPVASAPPAVTDTSRSLSAVTDVFGDLGPTQDTPLPSLDVFGSMGLATEAVPMPTRVEDEFGVFTNVASTINEGDDFGDFGGSVPSESVSIEGTFGGANVPSHPTSNKETDFGDFGSAALSATNNVVPGRDLVSFGNEGTVVGTPAVTELGRTMSEPLNVFIAKPSSLVDTGRSLSIDDAFGNIPDIQNAPLPPIDMIGSTSIPDTTAETATNVIEEDDDDFGGFEQATESEVATKQVSECITEGIVASTNKRATIGGDEFGDFDGSAVAVATLNPDHATDVQLSRASLGRTVSEPVTSLSMTFPDTDIGRSLSIDDAFGNIPVQDAPLPSLEMFVTVTHTTSASPVPQVDGNSKDLDAIGNFHIANEATSETMDIQQSVEPVHVGDFGNFNAARDASTSTMQTNMQLFDVPAMSDLGRTQSEPYTAPPSTVLEAGRSLSISDALPDKDTPLIVSDFVGRNVRPDINTDQKNEDDDFGDFEAAKSSDEDDGFGDFETSKQSDGDDFGAFDALDSVDASNGQGLLSFDNSALPEPHGIAVVSGTFTNSSTLIGDSQSNPFGDFEIPPNQVSLQETDDNDFGVFADSTIVDMVQQDATAQNSVEGSKNLNDFEESPHNVGPDEDDDFGAFGSAEEFSNAVTTSGSNDSLGVVPGRPDGPSSTLSEPNDDLFSAFDTPVESTSTAPLENISETQDFAVDFGPAAFSALVDHPQSDDPFGSSVPSESAARIDTPAVKEEIEGGFGDFAAGEAFDKVGNINDDEDFGAFGDFSSFDQAPGAGVATAADTTSKSLESVEDDDWGDFENVPSSAVIDTSSEEIRLRDQIHSLSLQLPESFLLKAGRSGEHVDLGEAFEINFGIDSALEAKQKRRVERCIQVLEALSRDNGKLASTYWLQVFEVINDEMDVAKSVVCDAKSLSISDWSMVEKPLSTMMAGLAEYMRVTRSIVASIGDLLLLDHSALLTVDTLASTWGSLTILEKALEIEEKWKSVVKLANEMSLKVEAVSLVDIRSNVINYSSQNVSFEKLCELTLQPLSPSDRSTTKADVTYQGKCFMACSGNFLAHRCPFYTS